MGTVFFHMLFLKTPHNYYAIQLRYLHKAKKDNNRNAVFNITDISNVRCRTLPNVSNNDLDIITRGTVIRAQSLHYI